DYAVPAGGVEIFESLVSHGGDVGKSFGAFESRLGEGIQLPALHVRGGCRHGVEAEIDLPADQVRVHGPRSAIGNVNTVDVRRHVEHRSGQMLDRARAGRTEGDFSRFLFAQFDYVCDCQARVTFVGHQQVRRGPDQGNGLKVAQGVVGNG